MVCPICKEHSVCSIDITKGRKVIGTNYYCRNFACKWEKDGAKRKVSQ